MFESFGESKDLYESVPMNFASTLGLMILQMINSNPGMYAIDLIDLIGEDPDIIANEIATLEADGLIAAEGEGWAVASAGLKELEVSNISDTLEVRYEYTKAPGVTGSSIIPTSRQFCQTMVGFNKYYTREDISMMSSILGYDVFKRRGGWMTVKGTNTHLPYCRHIWASRLVRKK